ncbi:CHAP domain-containing protein [Myroides fluvii]|uniref:CHAP domain-containing protein n=1 Tax=Myroides fluvii TaxID=2572594 RepID=UPI001E4E1A33|nr:CHAP domain-containing protein [Myroides fluvii]
MALTLTLYENTNLNLWKLEFKDRKATSMDLKIEQGKNTVYTPLLDTCEEAIYKASTHEQDRKSKILPRVFYMGISYEIEEEVSYWGLKQIKKKVIEELFPRGYTRNLANNDLLVNPLRSEIEAGISDNEIKKRIKQNEETIARYRAEGKFGHQYLHQLKLVKEITFGQAFTDKKIPVKVERAPHRLPDTVTHEKCPNCIAPVTVTQLAEIFKGSDQTILEAVAKAYTDYMTEFKMNTCWNKAHFFAQVVAESGSPLKIREENLNYSALLLETGNERRNGKQWVKGDTANGVGGYYADGNYRAKPIRLNNFIGNKVNANAYGRKDLTALNDNGIQAANQTKIADLAYGGRFGNNKDEPGGEGAKFKGRGYIQITFRASYEQANKYTKKILGVDVLTEAGARKVGTDPEVAMIASMAYWAWNQKEANHYSNLERDVNEVSKKVGNNVAYAEKKKAFDDKTAKVFDIDTCTFTYFPDHGDGVLEMMKRYAKEGKKYKKDSNRTSLKYKDIKEVDCSEFVCIYLHLLGLTKDVAWLTTGDMVSEGAFLKNGSYKKLLNEGCSIEQVDGKDGVFDPNFEPQPGDIFVWRKDGGDGHTGIVYDYDSTTEMVTILEAIGFTGSQDDKYHLAHIGIVQYKELERLSYANQTRVSYYQLIGKALQTHAGWKGYFRPKGYRKTL